MQQIKKNNNINITKSYIVSSYFLNLSLLNRVPCVPTWSMCPLANVLKRANVPKACQFFNLACQRAKRRVNFSTSPAEVILTFANFKNILAILENFSRETKKLNFHISKISFNEPKTFDAVFNQARGINQTIIRLV